MAKSPKRRLAIVVEIIRLAFGNGGFFDALSAEVLTKVEKGGENHG